MMRSGQAKSGQQVDVVVIGAGAMGSAAAYHLAKDGRSVCLLEQFHVGHTRGSSHGGSRIIRYAHEDKEFAQWMPATFALWRQLEQESGQQLLQLTGGLYLGLPNDPFLIDTPKVMHTLGFDYRMLTATDIRQDYPQFQVPKEWVALEQAETGILAAARCVQTLVDQAVKHGATVQEESKVLAVHPQGDGVLVRYVGPSGEQTVYADHAIMTAGPWARQLLDGLLGYALPLTPTHQQVAYFPVEKPADYALGRCPTYLFLDAGFGIYGFPMFERPGYVKVAIELVNTTIDPDQPGVVDQPALAQLKEAVATFMVGINPTPEWVETCRYTETPNRDFIIDRHPDYPQLSFAAGFSGRGFKHAIAIGRVLADMAQSEPGVYHSEFWSPRFALRAFAT